MLLMSSFAARPKPPPEAAAQAGAKRRSRPCVDWTERRSISRAQSARTLANRCCELKWIERVTIGLISVDCRIDNAIINLHNSNRAPAHTCPPTFGSRGSQETLPDECAARVTS